MKNQTISRTSEECLLLCMAYPDYSEKYKATICMAGITRDGSFRRIYPIPFEKYKETEYHKRNWIRYKVEGKGDKRRESRKIDPDSVVVKEEESYVEVRNMLEEKATTLEKLEQQREESKLSLGIIKPDIKDFSLSKDKEREEKAEKYQEQTTLNGQGLPVKVIPHRLAYQFNCHRDCDKLHDIMCEDIEIGWLYWRLINKYDNLSDVERKMKSKLVRWMQEKRDLYFMMGTHYHWGTWLIISILYPPKRKSQKIEKWT